jgi:hypothetical protein
MRPANNPLAHCAGQWPDEVTRPDVADPSDETVNQKEAVLIIFSY